MPKWLRWIVDRFFIKQPRLRLAVTRALETDHDETINLMGAPVRINTVKEHGYLRAWRKSLTSSVLSDEVSVLISLATVLQDGDTFVDIGANVGLFTAILARGRHYWPNIKFYAFEANPDTYQRLCETLKGLDVKVFPVALSDHAGSLRFVEGAVSHIFTAEEHAGPFNVPKWTQNVTCDRLDNFRLDGDSFVLKIDVEGQEREVLSGATRYFEEGLVKAVYLDGYKDPAVKQMLLDWGFELFDGRTLAPSPEPGFSVLALRDRSD